MIISARHLGAIAALVLTSAAANAATVTIHFDKVDGVSSAIWYEDSRGPSNLGGETFTQLSAPNQNQMYNEALYRPVLPADFAGSTVTAATFTVQETWGNGMTAAVKLSRINTPATWDPGTGMHADRWGAPDNGIQNWWADWDVAANSGVKWDGTTAAGPWDNSANPTFAGTAVGALIDTQTLASTGSATFNVLTLAQNWANGTWDNDGFVLQVATFDVASTARLDTLVGSRGLTLEYTPVPEPASLSLLALGGLALMRRRRA